MDTTYYNKMLNDLNTKFTKDKIKDTSVDSRDKRYSQSNNKLVNHVTP